MPSKKQKAVNFEDSLKELETLVATMEAGELSLEDSLAAFEKGIKLSRECQEALSAAEQKVSLLMEQQGEFTETAFEEDGSDD
jgi:exodeoxyribonuclease VII small subunit